MNEPMKTKRNDRNKKWAAILVWGILLTVANGQITAVIPDSAAQGTAGLKVTMTLNSVYREGRVRHPRRRSERRQGRQHNIFRSPNGR